MDDGAVGVYVHVPFCERVCPYCDFAVVGVGAARLAADRERVYVEALLAELARRRAAFAGRPLASLYLGGGTPSLLSPGSVARVIEAVGRAFPPADGCETTLEVNPGTLERERLPGFRAAGVGRLSVGVQSFDDATLKRLGRAHRVADVAATLAAARAAGFDALSLDLMLAAPRQREAGLARDLDRVCAEAPEHVSLYELTLEAGTPFAAAGRTRLGLPAEDTAARMLERAEARLGAAGYRRYELSNYARPGFEAVHNRRYWERRPVLGLGVGAHSLDPAAAGAPFGVRRANVRALADYQRRVGAGEGAQAQAAEVLTAHTARGEAAFLALRTAGGLDAAGFRAEFGAPPREFWPEPIARLVARGLLAEGPDASLRLTARGRLLADEAFQYFV